MDVIVEQEGEDGEEDLFTSIFSFDYSDSTNDNDHLKPAYKMQYNKTSSASKHLSKRANRRRDYFRTCMKLRAKWSSIQQAQQDLHRQHHNE